MSKIIRYILAAGVILLCKPMGYCSTSSRQTPVVKVIKENAGAVVNISTERIIYLRERPLWGYYDNEFDMFFDRYIGRTYAMKYKSVGSGVVVDKSGLIVTNAHVVNMASNIIVILKDGTEAEGQVVYLNAGDDLAIVKIDSPKPLEEVRLGTAKDIMIGETVVAVGNPLGLENSVTVGVLSGKNRKFYASAGEGIYDELLQTDAPINPGNSGGALLNLDGELIGINVAVVQNSQSIGFAIPVNKVKENVEAYRKNEEVAVSRKQDNQFTKKSSRSYAMTDEWGPFEEFERIHEQMNRLFHENFVQKDKFGPGLFNSNFSYSSNFDIEETDAGYIIKLEIANLGKQKIKVEVNRNLLTVSSEASKEAGNEEKNSSYISKSFNYFSKTLSLPHDADIKSMKTEINKDTLLIKLDKIK